MKIATLPRVLCLHLKRFKYIEQLDRRASSTCDGVVQIRDTLHPTRRGCTLVTHCVCTLHSVWP